MVSGKKNEQKVKPAGAKKCGRKATVYLTQEEQELAQKRRRAQVARASKTAREKRKREVQALKDENKRMKFERCQSISKFQNLLIRVQKEQTAFIRAIDQLQSRVEVEMSGLHMRVEKLISESRQLKNPFKDTFKDKDKNGVMTNKLPRNPKCSKKSATVSDQSETFGAYEDFQLPLHDEKDVAKQDFTMGIEDDVVSFMDTIASAPNTPNASHNLIYSNYAETDQSTINPDVVSKVQNCPLPSNNPRKSLKSKFICSTKLLNTLEHEVNMLKSNWVCTLNNRLEKRCKNGLTISNAETDMMNTLIQSMKSSDDWLKAELPASVRHCIVNATFNMEPSQESRSKRLKIRVDVTLPNINAEMAMHLYWGIWSDKLLHGKFYGLANYGFYEFQKLIQRPLDEDGTFSSVDQKVQSFTSNGEPLHLGHVTYYKEINKNSNTKDKEIIFLSSRRLKHLPRGELLWDNQNGDISKAKTEKSVRKKNSHTNKELRRGSEKVPCFVLTRTNLQDRSMFYGSDSKPLLNDLTEACYIWNDEETHLTRMTVLYSMPDNMGLRGFGRINDIITQDCKMTPYALRYFESYFELLLNM